MSRSKTHKEVEHYLGTIKELRSTVRKLQRELRYYQKREHIAEDAISGVLDTTEAKEEKKEQCGDCSKGELTFVIIANRGFKRCELCGFRSKAIKLEENESNTNKKKY